VTETSSYPPIEPYETGILDVGDGQSVYWEVAGNPDGKRPSRFMAGPAEAAVPAGGAGSIQIATGSSSSTSVAAG